MIKFLRVSFPSLLLFLTFGFSEVKHNEVPSSLLGSWEYNAPSIGLKYQKGVIEFRYEDGVLTGNVIFWNRVVPMKDLIYEDNKIRGHMVLDGLKIDLYFKFQSDSFQGTVSNPQGYIRISGNKVKP
jgi:hypothetical protein